MKLYYLGVEYLEFWRMPWHPYCLNIIVLGEIETCLDEICSNLGLEKLNPVLWPFLDHSLSRKNAKPELFRYATMSMS
jgi:hypothetical protein